MDSQSLINAAFALLNITIGFFLKWMYDSHRDLKKSDSELADKVQKIEVLVIGDYVRKTDYDKLAETIFSKLDRILEKLDHKQDKL
jgi:hypothetical protein